MKWVLVTCASARFFESAKKTILDAKTNGNWKDDIVLVTNSELPQLEGVEQLCVSTIGVQNLQGNQFEKNVKFAQYLRDKGMYKSPEECYDIKFHIFSEFFKQWDRVFFIDAGAFVNDDLARMTRVCNAQNTLFAHSNAYPTYQWKLDHEFSLDDRLAKQLQRLQALDRDYFQSSCMIFDTKLIESTTVNQLYSLAELFPTTGDQGTINLVFLKNWKQIPLRDEKGLLYDFWDRLPYKPSDYCLLKYHQGAWKLRA
jgi:hypothetical protein